jgi:fatty acid desaturase
MLTIGRALERYTVSAMSRRAPRLLALATVAIAILGALAPAAMAADGVGLWGRTDDKVVTYWGFGVMVFFVALVIVLSLIQIRLESRKERLRQELERLRPPAAE